MSRIFLSCSVPVTTCCDDRAFSALRILKKYIHNRINEDWLTGLPLMYIHPEIEITIHEVVDIIRLLVKRMNS